MRRLWNDNSISFALGRYSSGDKIVDIAKDAGVSEGNVRQVLKEKGVWVKRTPPRFSQEEIKQMGAMYLSGDKVLDIASKFGRNPSSFSRKIIPLFGRRNRVYRGKRKYAVDELYFDSIDCEHKAYWLGFLAADGCVRLLKNGGYVDFGVKEADSHILNEFLRDIQSEHVVRLSSKRIGSKVFKQKRVIISSEKLAQRLSDLGVVPRKSLIISWSQCVRDIPEDMIRHFVRGYFDGDGSWSGKSWSIVSGSKRLLLGMRSYLISILGLSPVALYKPKNYVLQWGGRKAVGMLYDFMYNDCQICLERKRSQAASIISDTDRRNEIWRVEQNLLRDHLGRWGKISNKQEHRHEEQERMLRGKQKEENHDCQGGFR